jgi:hypothetical protein
MRCALHVRDEVIPTQPASGETFDLGALALQGVHHPSPWVAQAVGIARKLDLEDDQTLVWIEPRRHERIASTIRLRDREALDVGVLQLYKVLY